MGALQILRNVALGTAFLWLTTGPLAAAGTGATAFDQYARAWALHADGDAAAWRLELSPEVYHAMVEPDARDLLIVDHNGHPMPMFRIPAEALIEEIVELHRPRFETRIPDPSEIPGPDTGLSLELERPDGTRLRLMAPEPEPGPARMQPVFEALIEAPRLHQPMAQLRLRLEWMLEEAGDGPLECLLQDIDDPQGRYRKLEVKRRFQTLPPRMLAEAAVPARVRVWFVHCRAYQAPGRIRMEDLVFETRETRNHNRSYLIEAEPESIGDGQWQWATHGAHAWQRLEVVNRQPGQLSRVELRYRDPRSGEWVRHAATELSTLQSANAGQITFELSRHVPRATAEWQVSSDPPLEGATTIVLHAHAEQWVFLSRGQQPGHLLAGSRRTDPADPHALAKATLDRIGPAWEIPEVRLGREHQDGSELALKPLPTPTDWKTLLLWTVLIAGALAVAGLAIAALRGLSDQSPPV